MRICNENDEVNYKEKFVFNIDKDLVIDVNQVFVSKKIGDGPMATVFQGVFESKAVAVKVLEPRRMSAVTDRRKERFEKEINLHSSLDHENIVKFVGAIVNPALVFVTELMTGDTLTKYLNSIRPQLLDLKLAISFALDVARAMKYLHGNHIVHRDLKPTRKIKLTSWRTKILCKAQLYENDLLSRFPDNVWRKPVLPEFKLNPGVFNSIREFLNPTCNNFWNGLKLVCCQMITGMPFVNIVDNLLLTEDKRMIKLADFGMAIEESSNEMNSTAGTYRWMAPEVIRIEDHMVGEKTRYDRKVDVYSFAIVFWELLTNELPFNGRHGFQVAYANVAHNLRPSLENIPNELAPFLEACWAANPKDRPEFVAITHFLGGFLEKLCIADMPPPKLMEVAPLDTSRATESYKKKRSKHFFDSIIRCFM